MKNQFISLVKKYFTDEKIFEIILFPSYDKFYNEKNRLEIGKVLYGNGVNRHGYIVTPYNIEIEKSEFSCKVSICYGNEIKYTDAVMNGLILSCSGSFCDSGKNMETSEIVKIELSLIIKTIQIIHLHL